MIHTFSQDQNLSLIYWALQSFDTLSNTECYQLHSLFRETPLRKGFCHRHVRTYTESSRLHIKTRRSTPGSWMQRCSTKDGAHPNWDHSTWAVSSSQGSVQRTLEKLSSTADTISPSSARALSTKHRYQLEHLQLPTSEAGTTLRSPSWQGHVKWWSQQLYLLEPSDSPWVRL